MTCTKKIKQNIAFILILIIFAIPPIFVDKIETISFVNWAFPVNQLLLAIFALLVLSFYNKNTHIQKKTKIIRTSYAIIAFGILCTSASLIELFAKITNTKTNIIIEFPSTFIDTFFCIINFTFAAIYEEIIYRLYLPESLNSFLCNIFVKDSEKVIQTNEYNNIEKRKKAIFIISEITIILLFAFAHKYFGFLSVINAFISGITLRVACKKSQSVFTSFIAHFSYNLLSLIIFALL